MSKILARSPYWINATATDLVSASIELWVYEGTATFSYTHLRAYETKANRVCRLLFDKKREKGEASRPLSNSTRKFKSKSQTAN